MIAIQKIAHTFQVSQEMLEDNPWTFEKIMQAAHEAQIRRANRLIDELIYGAETNPCIVLGEN